MRRNTVLMIPFVIFCLLCPQFSAFYEHHDQRLMMNQIENTLILPNSSQTYTGKIESIIKNINTSTIE